MPEELVRKKLLKQIVKVEDSYSLQEFNPLRAGGIADYFTIATSTVELAAAVKAAIDCEVPYIIIGTGGKILFSDGGFPGLVIHNKASSVAIAQDKSQMVIDSGLSLTTCVTAASAKGLGGLTNFYGVGGTIGGALYQNIVSADQDFMSLVRYVTVLMPPARLDREATINRYKRDWLLHPSGKTKLQYLRETKPLEPQPVILTVLLQLTSVRTDELRVRLQEHSKLATKQCPKGIVMGPLFYEPPGVSLSIILKELRVDQLTVGSVSPDKKFPNFVCSKNSVARSQDIRNVIELIQEAVRQKHGIELACRYEYGGVW